MFGSEILNGEIYTNQPWLLTDDWSRRMYCISVTCRLRNRGGKLLFTEANSGTLNALMLLFGVLFESSNDLLWDGWRKERSQSMGTKFQLEGISSSDLLQA